MTVAVVMSAVPVLQLSKFYWETQQYNRARSDWVFSNDDDDEDYGNGERDDENVEYGGYGYKTGKFVDERMNVISLNWKVSMLEFGRLSVCLTEINSVFGYLHL